jgi:hypothetical protein
MTGSVAKWFHEDRYLAEGVFKAEVGSVGR